MNVPRPASVAGALRHGWNRLRFRWLRARLAAPKLLRWFAQEYPEAVFVEVGANDGVQHDHLHPLLARTRWSGVMVEPLPYVFARLQRNYAGNERVTLEQAAIAESDGMTTLYHLRPSGESESGSLPDWYDAIGSFSRAAVLAHRHRIADLEDRLTSSQVPCLTLASLLARHGLAELDLLVVDTEGYDAEVLRQLDSLPQLPRLVIYEHFHLGVAMRQATREYMQRLGYEVMEEGFDSLCLHRSVTLRMRQRWRRLRPAVPGVSSEDEQRDEI